MTMDYCNGDETSPSQRSYSVLRSKFDAWLMEQAEEAGAQLITGIRVDNLVQRDGKVVGVEADGDVIEAKTVILADGVNSILAEKLGMAKRVKPTDVAVGVKRRSSYRSRLSKTVFSCRVIRARLACLRDHPPMA